MTYKDAFPVGARVRLIKTMTTDLLTGAPRPYMLTGHEGTVIGYQEDSEWPIRVLMDRGDEHFTSRHDRMRVGNYRPKGDLEVIADD